ncbi:TetR/AcrR family transcriptional regulator [Flavobacterium agrisoli]|uniref:TetR/AcrR family transcriptional regulator n=1 Tax=Flavobacterium agrisoli TaxID=2793066 RepID=A0A934PKP3_9FLAO|nr:TetR/AcrR family transcriptional regulator [Flavobacterium agrisoli]MBK0369055.1 TetR/AcrR family transcriptional regulator [Flavobacterium agrisoli]
MRTRDHNKEEIVKQNAIELLVEKGIEGFSMNQLAKKCNISVATLYIYYLDKDDLIRKIGIEIGTRFFSEMTRDFLPTMSFRNGLYKQWENRISFTQKNPLEVRCWELLTHSSYSQTILDPSLNEFKAIMEVFFQNAIANKELAPMSKEIFWSVAYGPLYSLLHFERDGKNFGGKPFKLTAKTTKEVFELVIKALTP